MNRNKWGLKNKTKNVYIQPIHHLLPLMFDSWKNDEENAKREHFLTHNFRETIGKIIKAEIICSSIQEIRNFREKEKNVEDKLWR